MPRMRFSKTGNAVWISHLDLMRALQRGFRRAGILLKHSQGYTPHPTLSIAMPLSVGVSSDDEIADFELEDGAIAELATLPERLNAALPKGITVLRCYDGGEKLKHLKWLDATLTLLYDHGVPAGAPEAIRQLFSAASLEVEKHGKNGPVTVDILPMLHRVTVTQTDERTLCLEAVVSAQNPTLNPLLLLTAVEDRLPALRPDFTRCHRRRLLKEDLTPFE